MDRPYDVAALVQRYSERRIRITDMIGRRGRFITLATAGFYYLYVQVEQNQTPSFASAFFQDNLLDGLVASWIFLGLFYASGFAGAFFYGPQSRVMDGVLARANCLLISTLWAAFKFVMVPIGAQLAAVFPKHEFAPVFALIWGLYLAADACAEVFGSLFGRQQIRVWGIGDVNRKSITGVVAAFLGSLALCVAVVVAHGLGTPWLVPRRRDCGVEHAARALLAAGDRRLHDGDGERADLPGIRRLAVLTAHVPDLAAGRPNDGLAAVEPATIK